MADETQAAASSEVTTRPMTEEEQAKYPPVRPTRQDVSEHAERGGTARQLADQYGITLNRAQALMKIRLGNRPGAGTGHLPKGLENSEAFFTKHNNVDLMVEKAVRRSRPGPTQAHGDDEETAAAVRALLVDPGSRRDATRDPAEILIDEEERNEMAATASTTWTKDELLAGLKRVRLTYADPGLVAVARVLGTTLARLAPVVAELGGLEALKAELTRTNQPAPRLPQDPDFEVKGEPEQAAAALDVPQGGALTAPDPDFEVREDPPIVERIALAAEPAPAPEAARPEQLAAERNQVTSALIEALAEAQEEALEPETGPIARPRVPDPTPAWVPEAAATATIQMRAQFVEPPASSDSGDAITVRLRGPKTIEAIRHCIDVLALAAGDGPVEITLQARVAVR